MGEDGGGVGEDGAGMGEGGRRREWQGGCEVVRYVRTGSPEHVVERAAGT